MATGKTEEPELALTKTILSSSNSSGQLDIFWHDCHTFGMNSDQVPVETKVEQHKKKTKRVTYQVI